MTCIIAKQAIAELPMTDATYSALAA